MMRSMFAKQHPNCGLLHGYVIHVMKKSGGGGGEGGGGGRSPSHSVLVALINVENVNADTYGAVVTDDDGTGEFRPIFRRDGADSLYITYSLPRTVQSTQIAEASPGKRSNGRRGASRGEAVPRPMWRKHEFRLRNGDTFWVSGWGLNDVSPGDVVRLNNVKITHQLMVLQGDAWGPRFNDHVELLAKHLSEYYFNADVGLPSPGEMVAPPAWPTHTILRTHWSLRDQDFPSAKKMAKAIHRNRCGAKYSFNRMSDLSRGLQTGRLKPKGGWTDVTTKAKALPATEARSPPASNQRQVTLPPSATGGRPQQALPQSADDVPAEVAVEEVRGVIGDYLENLPFRELAMDQRTYLLSVDPDPENPLLSCDDYDPLHAQNLAAFLGTREKSPADKRTEVENADFCRFLFSRGYLAKIHCIRGISTWPQESICRKKEQDDTIYMKMEIMVSVVSWGYGGYEEDPDYVSPMDPSYDVDVRTGAVRVPEGAKGPRFVGEGESDGSGSEENCGDRAYVYAFKRILIHMSIYGGKGDLSHFCLGPMAYKSLSELLVSHKIPFEALLEGDEEACANSPAVSEHLALLGKASSLAASSSPSHPKKEKKSVGSLSNAEFEERCASKRQRRSEKERRRWRRADEVSLETEARDEADGLIGCRARVVGWRLPEYLVARGVKLDAAAADEAHAHVQKSFGDDLYDRPTNPTSVLGGGRGFVYLNDSRAPPSKYKSTHSYYALVCLGSAGASATAQVHAKLEAELKAYTELSRKGNLSEAERKSVLAYLLNAPSAVFYYAVDEGALAKCSQLAEKRLREEYERYKATLELRKVSGEAATSPPTKRRRTDEARGDSPGSPARSFGGTETKVEVAEDAVSQDWVEDPPSEGTGRGPNGTEVWATQDDGQLYGIEGDGNPYPPREAHPLNESAFRDYEDDGDGQYGFRDPDFVDTADLPPPQAQHRQGGSPHRQQSRVSAKVPSSDAKRKGGHGGASHGGTKRRGEKK
jgi:hypothetical protein